MPKKKTTRKQTVGTTQALNTLVREAVELEQALDELKEELKGKRAAILELMESAGLDRFGTPDHDEALLIQKEIFTWNVDKLYELLDDDDYETLCPPTAKGQMLRKRLESLDGAERRELRRCAKVRKRTDLEVRPAPDIDEDAGEPNDVGRVVPGPGAGKRAS